MKAEKARVDADKTAKPKARIVVRVPLDKHGFAVASSFEEYWYVG